MPEPIQQMAEVPVDGTLILLFPLVLFYLVHGSLTPDFFQKKKALTLTAMFRATA